MSERFSLGAIALAALLAASAAALPVAADPPLPSEGTFSDAAKAKALRDAAEAPLDPGYPWENQAMIEEDMAYDADALPFRMNDDNDTAHYKRGRTLIIHIFIDHTGGSWSVAERDTAGAKADVAKDYFRQNAPAGANVTFDHEGTTQYWYYNPSLAYNIPTDGMNWSTTEDAVAALGFTDSDGDGVAIDDMTLYLQNWNGGYDNVIAVFQPADITGRAFASYGYARTVNYTDDNANVWAHEWGHSFGACDEYVENGHCNGGIDCGACQSTYLVSVVDNGNCQLATCPSSVSCLMINNTFTNICPYTLEHWAWRDSDGDGLLDNVRRRVSGSSFVDIWELHHNGWFYWNYTGAGMVYSQRWNSWAVVGLRSPTTADYDLRVYGDNNHNYLYAASLYGGSSVDFVVGDYNHSPLGNEHIAVTRFSGASDTYNLTWESGTEMLYPDGVARVGSWYDYNVVRIWDVPLFGGETVTFTLDITGGNLDLGMALFKSSGAAYWAPRGSAVWQADAGGVGATESMTYTVPEDDVYGLVVWSNSSVNGSFTIQIGPTPYTLAEETPFYSAYPLRLFNYDPNAFYWAFVGNRPDTGGNTTVRLFADAAYQTELEVSNSYNGASPNNVDFIAVDYNHVSLTRDYLRIVRETASGAHRTEWEQDPEILAGATAATTWGSTHVGKVWDVYMTAGQSYFFREYHGSLLDTGLYVFSSSDGDYYKPRAQYAAAANFRPASSGGEWFHYVAGASDWYGLVLMVNDGSSESYSVWWGPNVSMADEVALTRSEEIVFAAGSVVQPYWHVFAARPAPSDEVSVWLYGDDAYTITTLAVSDQTGAPGEVNYVVADYNHTPTGTVYPRFRRVSGTSAFDFEFEGQTEAIVWSGGAPVSAAFTWPSGDVAEAIDLWLPAGSNVHVEVEDLSGALDLGIAVFQSAGATYYASPSGALASSDAAGTGGTEAVDFTASATDWYGLVVVSNDGAGGDYVVTVGDAAAVAAGPGVERPRFDLAAAPNPFRGAAEIRYALPREDDVDLAVYDVAGRRVRQLVSEARAAGSHSVTWDGRDEGGRTVSAGVYLVRLRAGGEERIRKVIRVP